ncbi:MAG: hypothetical protein WBS18_12255 [Candidatus Acidiferrales bacterium]
MKTDVKEFLDDLRKHKGATVITDGEMAWVDDDSTHYAGSPHDVSVLDEAVALGKAEWQTLKVTDPATKEVTSIEIVILKKSD